VRTEAIGGRKGSPTENATDHLVIPFSTLWATPQTHKRATQTTVCATPSARGKNFRFLKQNRGCKCGKFT